VDFLSKIIDQKLRRVEVAKLSISPNEIEIMARKTREDAVPHALNQALSRGSGIRVIAEFKRGSPSKGIIRSDADPLEISRSYEAAGAAAVSVLTEADHFEGSLNDLQVVRRAISLPILRKDFIVEDYQVNESAAAKADAVLLIVAALDDETLLRLRRLAEDDLGIDALVEVHTGSEMDRALRAGARIIGVNNRNLSTFEVSLETSVALAASAPKDVLLVSESGIGSSEDIEKLHDLGYRGVLIGESLMRAEDPGQALRALISGHGRAKKDAAQ
jgi:indole-3-glycerol phosphate synthase